MDAVVCIAAGVLIAKLWRGVLATGPLKAPVESLACQCLVHEDDEDQVVLKRAVYAQVKHLLCADVLLFAKNLCGHFAGNEDGTALGQYLSALSGVEKGAVFTDLYGAGSIAFLTSYPVHCDALDQVQLYHLLAFCESPPSRTLPSR
ncbi:hypothetical protein T492DRAFT_876062 [Pavlovales sp. CCMP2436]|nr:hypothetical protein T492DRAFT_876062 [Pavlovales sp. CCMP2436]